MNNVTKLIQNHRSIRNFQEKEIPDEVLEEILKASQSMPSSHNGQQVSIIVVKDIVRKKQIAEISSNQPYIYKAPVFLLFVADFYKTSLACSINHMEQNFHNSLDALITASFDGGIAMGAAIVAAESFGLGGVPIGSVRENMIKLAEILNLPKYTLPLVGFCLGYPLSEGHKKPRLPQTSFAHYESYQKDELPSLIKQYDEVMAKYLVEVINRGVEVNWSSYISNIYKNQEVGDMDEYLKKQGFMINNLYNNVK